MFVELCLEMRLEMRLELVTAAAHWGAGSEGAEQARAGLRLASPATALDTARSAQDTVAWLQESMEAAGPACAAAGASVLWPQAGGGAAGRGQGQRTADTRDGWQATGGGTALPGVNSGKATAHAMLIRCLVLCRHAGAGGRDGGATAALPPSKVIRNLPALLQDMALCVAEAVAAVYMSDVRNGSLGRAAVWGLEQQQAAEAANRGQGGGGGGQAQEEELRAFQEVSVPALLHPRLATTRELERFRNHVAMAATLRRSYGRVRDMYEDRCAPPPPTCSAQPCDAAARAMRVQMSRLAP